VAISCWRFHGPVTRRPAPGPLSGAGSAPLPAHANGSTAQGPVVLPTASTGEQAASNGRQISYAEVGTAYAGVVVGLPVKGKTPGVDSSAPLPTTKGATQEGKRREGREGVSPNSPCVQVPQRGEGRHGEHYCWRTLKRSPHRTEKAKWDAQAHSQRYQLCASTRCFEGSNLKSHLSRGTRWRVRATERRAHWHHFHNRPSGRGRSTRGATQ
jgi:hypothetical protein